MKKILSLVYAVLLVSTCVLIPVGIVRTSAFAQDPAPQQPQPQSTQLSPNDALALLDGVLSNVVLIADTSGQSRGLTRKDQVLITQALQVLQGCVAKAEAFDTEQAAKAAKAPKPAEAESVPES